jgi:hypothetical protein
MNCICTHRTVQIHFNIQKLDVSATLNYWVTTASPALLTSWSPRVTSHRTTVQHGSVGSGSSTQRSVEELLCTAGHLHTSLANMNLFHVLTTRIFNLRHPHVCLRLRLHAVTGNSVTEFGFLRFLWPRIVTNFFIIKPNRCTNFTNLF